MILLLLILLILGLYLGLILYCKLTCGINKCSKHLVGQVVIVTGGNAGIGFATAKDMAERGAKVIIGCRNEDRGITARDAIIASTGNNDVHFKKLDLASFKSVREFAHDVLKNEKRIDILINNAGMFGTEKKITEDGLLLEMQTNHFGPFLLTLILLPLIKTSTPSRIINVASLAHKHGEIDFENMRGEKEYRPQQIYNDTKLCNVLMMVELAKRLKGTDVTINSLNPGLVKTDILNNISFLKYLMLLAKPIMKTTWEGAQTTIHLAVSPAVNNVSGEYFQDCCAQSLIRKARDEDTARKLWEFSEKVVNEKNN